MTDEDITSDATQDQEDDLSDSGGEKQAEEKLPTVDWDRLDDKLRKKMHHIRVELKRSAKKGSAFVVRALVKKVRFWRGKVAQAGDSTKDVPEDLKLERKKSLKKFEDDLEGIKVGPSVKNAVVNSASAETRTLQTVDSAKVVHHTLLSALKKSPIPYSDRLVGYWESEPYEKQEVEGENALSSMTRIEQRLASSNPVQEAVKVALNDLHVIITGRKLGSADKKSTRRATSSVNDGSTVKRKRAPDASDESSSDDGPGRIPASTFITSLGAGDEDDYISDALSISDMDVSDYDGPPAKKVKKNRRGQQARRALAEKVHGRRAKHLGESTRREQQQKPGRGTGKRGFDEKNNIRQPRRDGPSASKASTKSEELHPSWAAKRNQQAAAAPFQGKKIKFGGDEDDEGPAVGHQKPKSKNGGAASETLHPSWEAKRKAKEAQAAIMNAAKPKKIVFDNDDDD